MRQDLVRITHGGPSKQNRWHSNRRHLVLAPRQYAQHVAPSLEGILLCGEQLDIFQRLIAHSTMGRAHGMRDCSGRLAEQRETSRSQVAGLWPYCAGGKSGSGVFHLRSRPATVHHCGQAGARPNVFSPQASRGKTVWQPRQGGAVGQPMLTTVGATKTKRSDTRYATGMSGEPMNTCRGRPEGIHPICLT